MFWVFKLSFVVDILAFLTWQLFGPFFKKFGEFFFLSSGHSAALAFVPGRPFKPSLILSLEPPFDVTDQKVFSTNIKAYLHVRFQSMI
jgi:hypothetical protein